VPPYPVKKAAGVCRTKRGNYGRAVIETISSTFQIQTARFLASLQLPTTPRSIKLKAALRCLTISEVLRWLFRLARRD